MKVIRSENKPGVPFESLKIGDTFSEKADPEYVYIKIPKTHEGLNMIRLSDGTRWRAADDEMIDIVNGAFVEDWDELTEVMNENERLRSELDKAMQEAEYWKSEYADVKKTYQRYDE